MFLSFLAIPICPYKWNCGYLGIIEATNVASEEILLDTTDLRGVSCEKNSNAVYFISFGALNQWFSTGGSRPSFGSRALTYGSPNPVF